MANYRCIACGYIYSNSKEKVRFEDLPEDYKCPLCKRHKSLFELADEFTKSEVNKVVSSEETPYNAVIIDKNNPSIERVEGCINCGICSRTCIQREQMPDGEKCLNCVGCGQCIISCPKKVLQPKNDIHKFLGAKQNKKICIAYIAPASRVAIGDEFGYKEGALLGTKLVGLLKKIGFKYVFDVTFGADITVIEEANELLNRIKKNENLPLMTSCCPAWVRYAEVFYPELIKNLSTTKSPIAIMGTMVKKYFASLNNLKEEDIFTVAITPCTAKKWEITKPGTNTDAVITVSELSDYIKTLNINFEKIKRAKFDDSIGRGSGAGLIFGASGGVLESALRTAYYLSTGKDLEDVTITNLRGYNGSREVCINLGKREVRALAIDEIANAKPIFEDIINNKCKYDFIEIMNCRGGCSGGGGLPRYKLPEEQYIKEKRMESLYTKDENLAVRCAHNNPSIRKLYRDYFEYPLSEKAQELLHTSFEDKSEEKK